MWLWVTPESPFASDFFQFRVNIKNSWHLPGCGTPLNLTDCCHRLTDLSLCPFLSENGVLALALGHKKDSCCLYFSALTGFTVWRTGERAKGRQSNIFCLHKHQLWVTFSWEEYIPGNEQWGIFSCSWHVFLFVFMEFQFFLLCSLSWYTRVS